MAVIGKTLARTGGYLGRGCKRQSLVYQRGVLDFEDRSTVAGFTSSLWTQSANIKSAGVIKFGTEGTYAPFTFHDASGKLVGFDVELGQAIAARFGVKAEFI